MCNLSANGHFVGALQLVENESAANNVAEGKQDQANVRQNTSKGFLTGKGI
jgi:hypothetical protein